MPARPAQAPASAQAETISLPTGRPCSMAARALPPVMRAAKPKVVRPISSQAPMQATTPTTRPQCTSRPGMCRQHVGLADRQGGGLVEAGRIAQRALDQLVHDRDRDVGDQQAGDRLVDAAIVAQARRPGRCRSHRPGHRRGPWRARRPAPAGPAAARPPPPPSGRPAPAPPRRRSPPARAGPGSRRTGRSAAAAPPAAASSAARTRSRSRPCTSA